MNLKDYELNLYNELEKHNLLKIENETISLTPEGFLISNSIIGKLLE